jgi:hypothetical protein
MFNLRSMQVVERTHIVVCWDHNKHFAQLLQPLHLLETIKNDITIINKIKNEKSYL